MNKSVLVTISIVVIALSIISCKKDKSPEIPSPPNVNVNTRNIKYEIIGNYSGKLLVAYTNETGATKSDTAISFPWIKQITYSNSVLAIGIGGNSILGFYGAPNQKLRINIYSNNSIVKSDSCVTNNTGFMAMPLVGYTFP